MSSRRCNSSHLSRFTMPVTLFARRSPRRILDKVSFVISQLTLLLALVTSLIAFSHLCYRQRQRTLPYWWGSEEGSLARTISIARILFVAKWGSYSALYNLVSLSALALDTAIECLFLCYATNIYLYWSTNRASGTGFEWGTLKKPHSSPASLLAVITLHLLYYSNELLHIYRICLNINERWEHFGFVCWMEA